MSKCTRLVDLSKTGVFDSNSWMETTTSFVSLSDMSEVLFLWLGSSLCMHYPVGKRIFLPCFYYLQDCLGTH